MDEMTKLTEEAADLLIKLYQEVHRCVTVGAGAGKMDLPDLFMEPTEDEPKRKHVISKHEVYSVRVQPPDGFLVPERHWRKLMDTLRLLGDMKLVDAIGAWWELEGRLD
jgi:hypothetical protein